MVEGWRDKAPPGFDYAVKGSRFITHMKKLANLDGAVDKFFEQIEPLETKAGVILWQLPPMLRKDPERLGAFLHCCQEITNTRWNSGIRPGLSMRFSRSCAAIARLMFL